MAFYAVLPLLVLKFRRFWQRATNFGLLLLVCDNEASDGRRFGFPTDTRRSWRRLGTYPTTWLYLCLAEVLDRMMVERCANMGFGLSHGQLSVASVLTVVPVALLSVFALLAFSYLSMEPQALVLGPGAMIIEVLAILVFVSAVLGSSILKPVLNWWPLWFVGKISYSLYLLHSLVIFALATYVLPAVILWIADQGPLAIWGTFVAYAFVSVAVSEAIAYLSFRYIESPSMRIKPNQDWA